MSASTPAADLKIMAALKLLGDSHRTLNAACAELSSVVGMSGEWAEVGKVADSANAMWHKINALRLGGGYRLDKEPK